LAREDARNPAEEVEWCNRGASLAGGAQLS